MKAKPQKGKPASSEPTPGPGADEVPERWSVQRKTELVMRLLRGEALDAVSRESQVPAHELERWQRIFLEQGKRGDEGAAQSRHGPPLSLDDDLDRKSVV